MHDLSAERIRAALPEGARFGCEVHCFATTGSTNDVARQLAHAGAPEGTLVIADEQQAGRGRLQRRWHAPPGSSLLLSLLLRPTMPPAHAPQLTMCAGLAAVAAIREVTGLAAGLKWPNDVVVHGRKVGGILTESEMAGDALRFAVVGLGLNVNLDPSALPPLDTPATGLSAELGRPVSRLALLASLLRDWEARYRRLLAGESPHRDWAAALVTLGQRVQVREHGGDVWEGDAVGVTPEGALLVRRAEGRTAMLWSGDVSIRPAAPAG